MTYHAKDIKPIETVYKGYRFRSRLEARWAVFFDACGADWEYEPEGFDLGDGLYYLPDFLVHNVDYRSECNCSKWMRDLYIEVKVEPTEKDILKINRFACSSIANSYKGGPGLLVVSKIPNGENLWELMDYMWDIREATCTHLPIFGFDTIDGDGYTACVTAAKKGGLAVLGPDHDLSVVDEGKTVQAYNAARQARFEHGEKPRSVR